jgi:hypothetical protein
MRANGSEDVMLAVMAWDRASREPAAEPWPLCGAVLYDDIGNPVDERHPCVLARGHRERHEDDTGCCWSEPAAPAQGGSFRSQLRNLVNTCSMENGSDTPDRILAEYLCDALAAFDKAVKNRERWYGRDAERAERT